MLTNTNYYIYTIISILLWTNISFAQDIPKYIFDTDITVEKDGVILKNAWAGGLNFIQIETYDFNKDGIDDLLVFDRSGNRIMPFICDKSGEQITYKYDVSYAKSFTKVINWIKLIDYNCDGKKDLFAYNPLGIEVWKNVSTDSNIEFEQMFFEYHLISGTKLLPAIKTYTGGEYDTNLNIFYQDIPAIVDIENNGTIDILNFGLGSAIPEGSTIEFHKNLDPCGLNFVRETIYWGGFAENYSNNSVTLEVCNKPSLAKNLEIKMHAGSSLLVSDFSGNGLPDMLIGDITFENATLVYNEGDIDRAWMTEKDDNFPIYSTPIDLEYFPGFSMVDIDKNGKSDLIASPAIRGSMNINSVWRYKNISQSSTPHFVLDSKSFLQDEMIDVGEAANPHLYDIDGDGLLDLLVGNYGYYNKGRKNKSNISFYKNIGNASQPEFSFIESDFGKFEQYDWRNVYPAFGDINNNGKTDVIIGEADGLIHLFESDGKNNFAIKQFNYLGVDVGNAAMPILKDIDGDGLLDLIIGNKKGNLHFYKNNGTKENPNFELITKKWGGIDLSAIDVQGAWLSADIIDHTKNGKLLILATQTGKTFAYKNISTNADDVFELVSENYFDQTEGERAAIAVGDLNNDNHPDIVIGNMSGGLRIALDATLIEKEKKKLIIYPNPVIDKDFIFLKYKTNLHNLNLEVFDSSGKKIDIKILEDKIDISNLSSGIYILREKNEKGTTSCKFVVGG